MTYLTWEETTTLGRNDPMGGRPLQRGDAQNVVCVLSLDLASLRFLAHYLPLNDEFTKERSKDLDDVLAIIRESRSA